jgi:hypothetical protein
VQSMQELEGETWRVMVANVSSVFGRTVIFSIHQCVKSD